MPARRGWPWLVGAGAVLGLGLGNHLTLLLMLPGAAIWLWAGRRAAGRPLARELLAALARSGCWSGRLRLSAAGGRSQSAGELGGSADARAALGAGLGPGVPRPGFWPAAGVSPRTGGGVERRGAAPVRRALGRHPGADRAVAVGSAPPRLVAGDAADRRGVQRLCDRLQHARFLRLSDPGLVRGRTLAGSRAGLGLEAARRGWLAS